MQVRTIHPDDLSHKDVREWEAIRSESERFRSPYYSAEFARVLGGCRKDARIIIARRDDGEALAFVPVQISRLGMARPLGSPFTDCSGPILRLGDEEILPSILRSAGVTAYGYAGLDDSLGVFSEHHRAETLAYIADLSPGFEAYLESRRSAYPKHFKKARRLSRQAAREAGELEVCFHEPAPDILETLISWKREQYQRTGLHDVLAPDWSRAMLHACLTSESPILSGVLTTLRIDGKLAAIELGLRSHDVLHGWIAGYNQDFANYSPGILLQERLLQGACEAGIKRADLGGGAHHYKKYYGSDTVALSEGLVPACGFGGATRSMLGDAWMMLERAPLGPAARFAGSARRRLDNILAVETTFGGRARGVLNAFNKPG